MTPDHTPGDGELLAEALRCALLVINPEVSPNIVAMGREALDAWNRSAQSQPCGEASSSEEVFAGQDAELSGASAPSNDMLAAVGLLIVAFDILEDLAPEVADHEEPDYELDHWLSAAGMLLERLTHKTSRQLVDEYNTVQRMTRGLAQ